MIRAARVVLMLSAFLVTSAVAQESETAAHARVTHLLQRATWGARSQDIEAVRAMGAAAWLDRQLRPATIREDGLAPRLEAFPSVQRDMTEGIAEFQKLQRARRQNAQPARDMQSGDAGGRTPPDSARRQMRAMNPQQPRALNPQQLLLDLTGAKITRAVYAERQLEDVMTDFWYNHFNVFFGKGLTRYMVADYEAKAIRPHVFGHFRDMLGATARHPAMLFYLDNASSVAPDTTNPRVRAQMRRTRGINENYARELLELHTLGVDGGYTQQDVINVARAFTGWTFRRPGARADGEIAFQFQRALHDRGEKAVLGKTLKAGRGIEDGEAVLDMVSRHPATARHIARKLVERFVSDTPDPAFVDEIAAVFARTDGDLRAVTRALFTSDRFYDAKVQRAKVKTPFELVVSALRATGADAGRSRSIVQTLRTLGQLPYNAEAPTGYPAASEDWVNSGAMLNRMNFGVNLAAGRLDGVRIEPRMLTGGAPVRDANTFVPVLLEQLLPGVDAGKLQSIILKELAKPAEMTDTQSGQPQQAMRQNAVRALGLALGSPDFQRK